MQTLALEKKVLLKKLNEDHKINKYKILFFRQRYFIYLARKYFDLTYSKWLECPCCKWRRYWLKRCTCVQHGVVSKPALFIFLRP